MVPSADNDNTRRFAAGEIVFEQGDDADGVYIVQEGEIELLLDNVLVGLEQAGGIIGEMAMIEESTRSATARASPQAVACRGWVTGGPVAPRVSTHRGTVDCRATDSRHSTGSRARSTHWSFSLTAG